MIEGINISELLAQIKTHKDSFIMLGMSFLISLVLAYALGLLLEKYIQKHLDDSPWLEENRKKIRYGMVLSSTIILCISFLSTTEVFRNLSWILAPLALGIVYLARKAIQNVFEFFVLLFEGKIMTGHSIHISNEEFHIYADGKIKDRNSRKAFLKTYDGGEILLRHHWIFEGIVHNYSRSTIRRIQVRVTFPISASHQDIDSHILNTLKQYPHLLPQYPQDALLLQIKDGQYHYLIQFWIDRSETNAFKAKQECRRLLLKNFAEHSLPTPQIEMDYHTASQGL